MLPFFAALALAAPEDQVMVNSSGETLHWTESSVPFRVNAGNLEGISVADVDAAVEGAAAAWSTASEVHVSLDRSEDTTGKGGLDETNVVYFSDDWTASPDLLALTSSWSDDEGVMVEFDLAINADDHAWSTTLAPDTCDLQNTLTHEMGHALGIDHDEVNVEATMFPNATLGETIKRDLYDSDVEVAAWLYPERADEPATADHPLFACSAVPAESFWLAAPALLFLSRRRKE